MALISVIMPVYNGEKYISKGIESILAQTYEDLELILVDDGSRDASLSLCNEYALKDKRVVVVSEENGGVGKARTTGLMKAKGEYVAFIDQDDYYDDDALIRLYLKAAQTDADMVIASYRLVNPDGSIRTVWKLDEGLPFTKYRIVAPWGKLVKKSFIDEHKLRFPEIKISEDTYFNMLALSHTDQVAILDEPVYNWVYNKASESRTNWNHISEDRNMVLILSKLWDETKDSIFFDKEKEYVTYFFTKHLVWYILYNRRGNQKSEYKSMTKACFAFLDENFHGYRKLALKALWFPKGDLLFNRLCVVGTIWLHRMHIL